MLEPDRNTEVQNSSVKKTKNMRRPVSWECRIHREDGSITPVPITIRGIVIGAAPSCDLVLNDSAVSGKHLKLTAVEKGVLVEDLESTNGTYLRTARIDRVVISSQCQVVVGTTSIEISPASMIDIPPYAGTQFGSLVGHSLSMRKCFAIMNLASKSDATVVIEGESGTGKELAAHAIHENSSRAHQPFVVVDCAGIAEQLIETHLFGHRQGAFTGAVAHRKGAFVLADGGTVFLDELGELPLSAQRKLLRVLEAGTVQPLGEERPVQVNVRVIAATNRNLEQMVGDEQFRFDLFHRLSVIRFQMPPLRDHPDDIKGLVEHFYRNRNMTAGPIEGEGFAQLVNYDWPGNVRELRNVLERAWVLSGEANPLFEQLQFSLHHRMDATSVSTVDTSIPYKEAKEKWLSIFEEEYIRSVIAAANGNISLAASMSGINRNHVRTLMEKYHLTK